MSSVPPLGFAVSKKTENKPFLSPLLISPALVTIGFCSFSYYRITNISCSTTENWEEEKEAWIHSLSPLDICRSWQWQNPFLHLQKSSRRASKHLLFLNVSARKITNNNLTSNPSQNLQTFNCTTLFSILKILNYQPTNYKLYYMPSLLHEELYD